MSKATEDFMTAEEQDILRGIDAAIEAGQDPFGDGAEADAPEGNDQGGEAGDGDDEQVAEPEAVAGVDPEPAGDDPDATIVDAPAAYKVDDTASIGDKRKALRAERNAIESKWISGDLSDDERAEMVGQIDDKLDALLIEQTRAETLAEANRQQAEREQARILNSIRSRGTAAGIDYGAPGAEPTEAAILFDGMLQAVARLPKHAGASYETLCLEAHKMVLAASGKSAAAEATTAQPAKQRAKPPAPPMTLRNMPAAAQPNAGSDVAAKFSSLSGEDAESFMARLSPSERAKLMGD